MESAPPQEPPATGTMPGGDAVVELPPSGTAQSDSIADKAAQVAATQSESVAVEPVARPATPSITQSAGQNVAKADAPAAKAPAKVPVSPAPKEQMAKKEGAAPAAEKPAAPPPLDLTSLEKRLRDTNAIGVFTKLTLKNQVDDLLNRFREYYQGRLRTTLAELRQPYDLLILKVLSLLQDGDPSLASAIRASREAIWGILSDPAKFSRLAS